MMRIGTGFDVHAYGDEAGPVVVGGVRIPHDRGVAAHSDGDVLLHALCDALLGAAGLGDVGIHFPGTPEYKNISSMILLERTMALVGRENWEVMNIDVTLIAEQPQMRPFIGDMKLNIGSVLRLDVNCINIKATTTDKLGFIGRGEGIAALSMVLIRKKIEEKVSPVNQNVE